MKKIISLLASIAMLATMVTSVSAATIEANEPVISTEVTLLDAASYAEYAGVELEEGTPYLVTATITGLDLSMVRGGSSTQEKKTRTGVGLSAAQYDIVWDSEDNIIEWFALDDGLAAAGESIKSGFVAMKQIEAYPVITNNNNANPEEATEAYLNSYIVVVSGDVTGTVAGEAKVTQYEKNSIIDYKNFYAADLGYEVNGEATATVVLAAGGEEGGDEEEKITEVVISDKIDVAAEGAIGAAWDVTIKNFDSAKAYMATFTDLDTSEVRRGQADEIDVSKFAETTGDVSFAVIMKLLTVTNVGLNIAIQ